MTAAATTFRITTYYKRKRGEPGMTQIGSTRIVASQALDWVLRELPDEAIDIQFPADDRTVISIDWARVPAEIREGVA